MDNVSLLRLDQVDGLAPGNKIFKLRHNLLRARESGYGRVLSFGGVWSNHLHALAAVAKQEGLEAIAIVRGDEHLDTAMLLDVQRWGMQVIRVSRQTYRRRNNPDFHEELQASYGPCFIVPEGGANGPGAQGCVEIADLAQLHCPQARRVVLPVGTGTTLAGVVAGLLPPAEVIGISALKGANDLEERVESALQQGGLSAAVPWRILHQHHCGGFARVSEPLREFMLAFEQSQKVLLDPVYTGKALFAIHSLLASGEWSADEPVLAIHTGGLQGRRGFPWLTGSLSELPV